MKSIKTVDLSALKSPLSKETKASLREKWSALDADMDHLVLDDDDDESALNGGEDPGKPKK